MERAPSRRNGIRGVKGHNMDEISFARIPLAHSDPEKVTLKGEGFLSLLPGSPAGSRESLKEEIVRNCFISGQILTIFVNFVMMSQI